MLYSTSPNKSQQARLKPRSWRLSLLVQQLARLHTGTLHLWLPDKTQMSFEGVNKQPEATLHINSSRLVNRLLRAGELGFAEGYIEGDWNSPDLRILLYLLHLNSDVLVPGGSRLQMLSDLTARLRHRLHRNTKRGSRRNIAHHYDLGNDFYRLWLDKTWTYSCALFKNANDTLASAQRRKYQHLLNRLQPGKGDHILELGCGWGGFALYAVQQTGCRVTGITLSEEQLHLAQERARGAGLDDRVTFHLCDYRDIEGQYDHIASIEMIEAVGEAWWPVYFRTLHDRLKPGGRAAIQTITIADEQFATYRSHVDFIQTYIFPGGMLPSPKAFHDAAAQQGLSTDNTRFHGSDYDRTLVCWDDRVIATRDAIFAQRGERFWRMWHYYLAYCSAGFISGNIDLMQTTLVRSS